jgi:hypothetical protein
MCLLSNLKGAKASRDPRLLTMSPQGAAFVQMVYTISVTMNIRLFIQCSIEAILQALGPAELDFAVSTLGPISSRGLSPLSRGNSKNNDGYYPGPGATNSGPKALSIAIAF